jgi:glycosyltransferase involved in cell wall biosynthesis
MLKMKDISVYSVEEANTKGIGYAVHAEETKKALQRIGVVFDDDADIIFYQRPAHAVKRIEGKLNILYTAFETEDVPDMFIDGAKQMDIIFCTSDFVTKAFKRRLENKIIITVPLGVDVNTFNYIKRQYHEPFIYLWVGAPDFRKGWDIIMKAWKYFEDRKDVGLIMKTTGRGKLEAYGNVVMESRKLSTLDLVKIYNMAHCFIFPSYCEGFGLPLAEALSTGMPSVFVPYGGVNQFANRKNAFPLKYTMVPIEYGCQTKGAMADIKDMIETMEWIKDNYKRSVVIAKNGRRIIENDFTWDKTARTIKSYIEEYMKNGTINDR